MVNNDIVIVTNKRLKTFGETGIVLGFDWGDTMQIQMLVSRKTYSFKEENLRVQIPALCRGDACVYEKEMFYIVSFYRGGYGINKAKPKRIDTVVGNEYIPNTLWVSASMITRLNEVDFVE